MVVIEDFERPPKELLDAFREYFTGCVSDALNKSGAMISSIKPVVSGVKIVGPALTVRTPPGDVTAVIKAVELAKPGDVIVIDARGHTETAIWGELLTLACIRKGVEGVIIDGAVRDIQDMRKLGYPVFARAVVPSDGVTGHMGDINIPIQCGGVAVAPGDIVIGDDDGVVVVPRGRAEETLAKAKEVYEAELMIKKGMEAGRSLGELLAIDQVIQELEAGVITPQMKVKEVLKE